VSTYFRGILYDFLRFSGWTFLVLLGIVFLTSKSHLFAAAFAYLLSFLFVGSNFFVIKKIYRTKHSRFYRHFFISLATRFVLVLVALVVVLKATKIPQIYFTVSFIISYIFHSVIEIISINKLLETDN